MISTINLVNNEIHKETGFDETLIAAVNTFFWKEVKKTIRTGEEQAIRLRGLGTFATSMFKLKQSIISYIGKIRAYRNPNATFVNREETLGVLIENLKKLLKRRNELATVYYIKYLKDKVKKKQNEEL